MSRSEKAALAAALLIWVATVIYLYTSAGCSSATPC